MNRIIYLVLYICICLLIALYCTSNVNDTIYNYCVSYCTYTWLNDTNVHSDYVHVISMKNTEYRDIWLGEGFIDNKMHPETGVSSPDMNLVLNICKWCYQFGVDLFFGNWYTSSCNLSNNTWYYRFTIFLLRCYLIPNNINIFSNDADAFLYVCMYQWACSAHMLLTFTYTWSFLITVLVF